MAARRFGGFAQRLAQCRVQHILHQRRFARTRHAGDAGQPPQREIDIDVFQVVFSDAAQAQLRCVLRWHAGCVITGGAQFTRQITPGDRILGCHDPRRRVEADNFAAARAGARTDIENTVGGEHDLRIVFHHHQRIAGVAQFVHDADDTAHVARVQSDRRFIEHKQRVDQGSAERGGQVDPLHLAAGERARLAVQRQVTQADLVQVFEPGADFADQHVRRFIQRRRQFQRGEK